MFYGRFMANKPITDKHKQPRSQGLSLAPGTGRKETLGTRLENKRVKIEQKKGSQHSMAL